MSDTAMSDERLGRMHARLTAQVQRGAMPGLVYGFIRHGVGHVRPMGTLTVDGTRPMQRDTLFRIASLTKPVVAVAALTYVEDCTLQLDDPVDQWLPELAGRPVLRRPDGPLDDTVAANGPVTVRHLLTLTGGTGVQMSDCPAAAAMSAAGLNPSAEPHRKTSDEYLAALAKIPLLQQPGEGWYYHHGAELLGILLARLTGRGLGRVLQERVLGPLGMTDTGFFVPEGQETRLPGSYRTADDGTGIALFDDPVGSHWLRPPAFESGGGGLVSTVEDYLRFGAMLLNRGRFPAGRLLSRPTVEVMTTDQLSASQRVSAGDFLEPSVGWGLGIGVDLRRDHIWRRPGRFGWDGGSGTSAYVDPTEDLVGVLFTQRLMDSPRMPSVFNDFWTSLYAAIDD